MSNPTFTIEALKSSDLPAVAELQTQAFHDIFKKLLGFVPPIRPEGVRVANRFFRPGTEANVLRDDTGTILGCVVFQASGSRCVSGPVAVLPGFQGRGGLRDMCGPMLYKLREKYGTISSEIVTFPHSPLHFQMYQWLGGEPLLPAPSVKKKVAGVDIAKGKTATERFSDLSDEKKKLALAGVAKVSGGVFDKFDLSPEVTHVFDRKLGETLLTFDGDVLTGFAVCHFGPGSEAFADSELCIKNAIVDAKTPEAAASFDSLLAGAEELAASQNLAVVQTMVSSARRAGIDGLRRRAYEPAEMNTGYVFFMPPDADGFKIMSLEERRAEWLRMLGAIGASPFVLQECR